MGDLDNYIQEHFSNPATNQQGETYGVLDYFDAELSNGDPLYDDQDNLIVKTIQPDQKINVTLMYSDKTLCTYW